MKPTAGIIEVIVVRLNRIGDEDVIRQIFQEMTKALRSPSNKTGSAMLCRNELVKNEWTIYLCYPARRNKEKTDLAENLVGILRSVGLVNYTVWKPC